MRKKYIMNLKIYKALRKCYWKVKAILKYHPIFTILDKIKLSKITRNTNKKGYIFLRPRGWLHNIKIRKNYTDKEVVQYVLQDQYHLPPAFIKIPENAYILDLGSNIGLTIAHFKHLYPASKIIGFEMNAENYALAKRNIKFLDNVTIENKAVWTEDTVVKFKINSNYDSYKIINNLDKTDVDEVNEVQSICLKSIIKNHKIECIDYLKMDIEGAEKAILLSKDLSWMNVVYAMNIELHLNEGEDFQVFLKILETKGFQVWKDDRHWSSIFAVNSNFNLV